MSAHAANLTQDAAPSGAGRHRLVVVGAGFGGIELVKRIRALSLAITLVDRRSYHLFQPLLYQAATAILAPSEIAWPVRQIFRDRREVETVLASVTAVDRAKREVHLSDGGVLAYDTLVIATGATHAYFGHDEWEAVAPGLKSVEDATQIRSRVLRAFERAERSEDPAERAALLTFAIVGAGPTGVELAGMIAELAQHVLLKEYRRIDTRSARVVLIEAASRILSTFDPKLAGFAHRALERGGVEIRVDSRVTNCTSQGVTLGSELLPCRTIVWAAGVRASPVASWLGIAGDRAGRIVVEPDLSIPGDSNVFVIGDTASVRWNAQSAVPGIAPAAKQQGAYLARLIGARLRGRPVHAPFVYRHQGSLATIGRRAAIIDFGWLRLTGTLAWWVWGIAHIYFLIGARTRLAVAWSWLWAYFRNHPSAQLITEHDAAGESRIPQA